MQQSVVLESGVLPYRPEIPVPSTMGQVHAQPVAPADGSAARGFIMSSKLSPSGRTAAELGRWTS